MKVSRKYGLLLATSSLAWSISYLPARAADAGGRREVAGIQEIVVTAQRQAQNLLSVPLSITALTSEQLNNSGLKDITALQFSTPGYVVAESSGYTQIFVRGVGNSLFVGADPSVATFIDDVPRIYGSMVNGLVDVERVEVLKGAQGGLYGRNATGGVLNIITRQPSTDNFYGNVLVSYGEKNTFKATGYVNVPLSDKVALNISAQRDSHDAYVKNLATNPTPFTVAMFPTGSYLGSPQQTANFFNAGIRPLKGYGNQDFWAVGGKLLLKANDNFKVTIAADYSEKHDTDGAQFFNFAPSVVQASYGALLGLFGFNAQIPPGFVRSASEKFTTSKVIDAKVNRGDTGVSATAVWSLPGVDLTSISAYRAQRPNYYDDIAAVSVPVIWNDSTHYLSYFYQELRAISTGEGSFHWLGGATYLRDHFEQHNAIDLLPPLLVGASVNEITIVKNWSVYAQVGYDISPQLNLTISGRYIHETNNTNFSTPVVSGTSSTAKKFLPSATLSYKLAGDGNVYARWARGWKGGGVNPIAPPIAFPGSTGSVFAPETVDTYEAGYRAPLFDRTVQVTGAAFYNDYKNLQVNTSGQPQYPAIIFAIVNAGTARTWGVEGSLTWRVIEPLTVGITAGYLNAKYKDFALTNSAVLIPFDRSGTTMINSPKLQLAFTADLDQPLNDKIRLVGTALVSHISRTIFGASPLPGLLPDSVQPGYWLANVRLGVRTTDDRYGLAVYANNVFNKEYSTIGASSATTGVVGFWGKPRIIGGEISVKF